MKLNNLLIIGIVCLLIGVTGCSNDTSTKKPENESANNFLDEENQDESKEIQDESQDEEVSPAKSEENNSEDLSKDTNDKLIYIEVPMNSSYKIDLDGDGEDDEVNVSLEGEGILITVGDINYTTNSIFAYTATDNYAIVDIDEDDKYKEIIISDYGPSADYTSNYFYYNGNKIVDMGMTGGLYNEGINIHGDGTLTAMFRFSVFQTWFGEKDYSMNQMHQLVEIPQKLYKTNHQLTTKIPIELLTDSDLDSSSFIIDANKKINLIACDDKEWILAKDEGGKEGWFKVDLSTLGVPTDIYIMEIFEGIHMYD